MTEPGKPLGMSDFFGLEAGEYLERLDALLGKPEPAAEDFVRHARALRGSALMAKQAAIARAATGLETLARTVRDGRRAWDVATKQLAVRALDDLKVQVRRAASWTDAVTAKADGLAAELERLAGRPSGAGRPGEAARAGGPAGEALELGGEPVGLCRVGVRPARGAAHQHLEVVHRAHRELLGRDVPRPAAVAHGARQRLEPRRRPRDRRLFRHQRAPPQRARVPHEILGGGLGLAE